MTKNVKPDETTKTIPEPLDSTNLLPEDAGVGGIDSRNKNISLAKIIELKQKGLSCQQIATLLKCSKQNIYQRLQDYEDFEGFAKDTALRYETLQYKIYNAIDDGTIEKANLQSKVWAIAVLEDKKRLIRNQTTAIIDIDHTIGSITDLSNREKILEARYRLLTGKELRTDTNK